MWARGGLRCTGQVARKTLICILIKIRHMQYSFVLPTFWGTALDELVARVPDVNGLSQ